MNCRPNLGRNSAFILGWTVAQIFSGHLCNHWQIMFWRFVTFLIAETLYCHPRKLSRVKYNGFRQIESSLNQSLWIFLVQNSKTAIWALDVVFFSFAPIKVEYVSSKISIWYRTSTYFQKSLDCNTITSIFENKIWSFLISWPAKMRSSFIRAQFFSKCAF